MAPLPLPGETLRILPAYVFGWAPDGHSMGRVDGMVVTYVRRVPIPPRAGRRVAVVEVLRPDGQLMRVFYRYLAR